MLIRAAPLLLVVVAVVLGQTPPTSAPNTVRVPSCDGQYLAIIPRFLIDQNPNLQGKPICFQPLPGPNGSIMPAVNTLAPSPSPLPSSPPPTITVYPAPSLLPSGPTSPPSPSPVSPAPSPTPIAIRPMPTSPIMIPVTPAPTPPIIVGPIIITPSPPTRPPVLSPTPISAPPQAIQRQPEAPSPPILPSPASVPPQADQLHLSFRNASNLQFDVSPPLPIPVPVSTARTPRSPPPEPTRIVLTEPPLSPESPEESETAPMATPELPPTSPTQMPPIPIREPRTSPPTAQPPQTSPAPTQPPASPQPPTPSLPATPQPPTPSLPATPQPPTPSLSATPQPPTPSLSATPQPPTPSLPASPEPPTLSLPATPQPPELPTAPAGNGHANHTITETASETNATTMAVMNSNQVLPIHDDDDDETDDDDDDQRSPAFRQTSRPPSNSTGMRSGLMAMPLPKLPAAVNLPASDETPPAHVLTPTKPDNQQPSIQAPATAPAPPISDILITAKPIITQPPSTAPIKPADSDKATVNDKPTVFEKTPSPPHQVRPSPKQEVPTSKNLGNWIIGVVLMVGVLGAIGYCALKGCRQEKINEYELPTAEDRNREHKISQPDSNTPSRSILWCGHKSV